MLDKEELRQHMRQKRKMLSLTNQETANIVERFQHLISNFQHPTIALYEKMGGEIDPACLVEEAEKQNIQCVFPEVIDSKTMTFTKTPDILIIPLLAFDRQGNRLGQGGGYYDRYLENNNALKIGLAYAQQEYEGLPTEPHDQKLDWIITPKEAIKVG